MDAGNPVSGALPRLVRTSDKREFPLTARLTTIGASPQCRIVLQNAACPSHLAHIMFSEGIHSIAAVSRVPPLLLNGKTLKSPAALAEGDELVIGGETYRFTGGLTEGAGDASGDPSALRRFVAALSRFSRTADSDLRSELLAAVAGLLGADAARLVIEGPPPEEFSTIARYPAGSDLDRFSRRAIVWARQEGATVLMHDTDWEAAGESKGSLEINKVGSILCRPIYEGDIVRGFLYLDKQRERAAFSPADREMLDDVGPLFGDLLALYDRTGRQRETIARLQADLERHDAPIVFECEAMRRVVETAARFAATDATVLVTGETGTGKELFARFVHRNSNRRDRDFCAINCGALPENLIESELFGHEKGSFTGAHQKKTGLFERARGGTVFLDEIGEMPLNLQVKLLRVLQESEMVPVGSVETIRLDVRVIVATNRDLAAAVAGGTFREDLFYRINVLELAVPPLRDRHRDALLLADYFIKKYSRRFGLPEKALSLGARARLLKYSWPGNIRQLENVVQKALLVATGNLIAEEDCAIADAASPAGAAPELTGDSTVQTLKEARAIAELRCIEAALSRANGNVSIAARLLATDRKWLTKLMKLYGIGV
jgi:transcriptional regulator with GAF, ATPase, and Fis domain